MIDRWGADYAERDGGKRGKRSRRLSGRRSEDDVEKGGKGRGDDAWKEEGRGERGKEGKRERGKEGRRLEEIGRDATGKREKKDGFDGSERK